MIASGNDASVFKGQTVRTLITNQQDLDTKKDQIARFIKAYRETIDWMYSSDDALKVYAEWLGITVEKAKRTRDGFFPRAALEVDKIVGLDTIVNDAVELKYTPTPLTKEQIGQLIQLQPK